MLTKEIKELFGKRKPGVKVVKQQSPDIDVKDPRFYDKDGIQLSPSRCMYNMGIQ